LTNAFSILRVQEEREEIREFRRGDSYHGM